MPAETIVAKFHERVRSHPDKVALRRKDKGAWIDITWRGYGDAVRGAGKALLSLGFKHSDKISLLSGNRPEWHFVDVAAMSLGGATAAIYGTSSPEQVAYIVKHSDSKVAFVENPDQLEKILKMREGLKKLKKVVVFEGYEGDADPKFVMSWSDFLALGDGVEDGRFDDALAAVQPDDLATFVYTSGTTGPPKAVMLTHRNIFSTAQMIDDRLPFSRLSGDGDAKALSYLPLSHIAERMVSHLLQIYNGSQTWFSEGIDHLLENLNECKPTYFFGVPRVYEKFYAGVQAKMAAADPNDRKAKLAKKAIEVGRKVAEAEQKAVEQGKLATDAQIPLGLKVQHRLLDKLVLHKVRAAFGLDECELPVSAAAPLSPELIWFFHSIGLRVAEGYGQSEDNGPTTWNPPDAIKIGSVGKPLKGVEVKLAEDGEILVRGANVMAGYYKDKKSTGETLDADGWLHSGDIGEFDDHGYLKITDRKKDLIITAGGKNIAPQEIENKIKFHPLISQVVVIGDRRPFLTALITLDEEKAPSWAQEQGIEGDMAAIASHERTIKEIDGSITEINKALAKVEGVKKFRILERDFLEEENEITPTLKVKRKQINEIYAEVIEDMYKKDSPSGGSGRAPVRK